MNRKAGCQPVLHPMPLLIWFALPAAILNGLPAGAPNWHSVGPRRMELTRWPRLAKKCPAASPPVFHAHPGHFRCGHRGEAKGPVLVLGAVDGAAGQVGHPPAEPGLGKVVAVVFDP